MNYVSTRGRAPTLPFSGVLLAGLASDGGLYVPETWPQLTANDFAALEGKSYAEVALAVMRPFVGESVSPKAFEHMVTDVYGKFGHPAVAPLRQTGPNDWLMELFHGPTLAFKDVALQLLGRLFDDVLKRENRRITIVGATSGDTGSAAIEGCRGRDAMDVFILYPHGRVSDVQRRQMTTVADANVHCLAVEGTFDDCQALVKSLFNDVEARAKLNLSAVNSINWARVLAQIVYYVTAAIALGATQTKTLRGMRQRRLAFVVPTGNFGDIYAGYAAHRMGLPVEKLVIATNRNDILTRFFKGGEYRMAGVEPTISPSMDIQISSNFERLLFELEERDGAVISQFMDDLGTRKAFAVKADRLKAAKLLFGAGRADEGETLAVMRAVYAESGMQVDPHSAVGLHVARMMRRSGVLPAEVPVVTLATAHPAKFPDAVEKATGQRPALPARLADLLDRKERFTVLPNDFGAIRAHIEKHARPV